MPLGPLFSLSLSGRGLGRRAHQEEETGGSLLCADVANCGRLEKDASHRPQHVHAGRPGAHLPGQDTLQSGKPVDFDVIMVSMSLRRVSVMMQHFLRGDAVV